MTRRGRHHPIRITFAMAIGGLIAPGCHDHAEIGGFHDGSSDSRQGSEGGQVDGSEGGGVMPGKCVSGEPVCDGAMVRSCDAMGNPAGPALEDCGASGGGCVDGRCWPAACVAAARRKTYLGCLFYTVDAQNTPFDNPLRFTVALGNSDPTSTASVTIERLTAGAWAQTAQIAVGPGQMQVVPLCDTAKKCDTHAQGSGIFPGNSFRVRSDFPIAAYSFNSDDQITPLSYSSGATLLIPSHVLGRRHYAFTSRMPTPASTPLSGASPAQIQVIGVHKGTHVTVRPRAPTPAGPGLLAADPGTAATVTLDEGDLLQMQTGAPGDDLTGSEIVSDKPVAVFSGDVCALDGHGIGTDTVADPCDMSWEQMLPVETWGSHYVGGRAEPQGTPNCSAWDLPNLWTVMASEDGTKVTFETGSPKVIGVPTATVLLDRGQFRSFAVSGTVDAPGDFFLESNNPVMLAQTMPCEPSIGMTTPAEQLLDDFMFFTPAFFDNMIVVTRHAGEAVTLDGVPVNNAEFVPAGGGFEVFRHIYLRQDTPCAMGACAHRIQGSGIGVTVRGMDGFCSYLYIGGMAIQCVNVTAQCN